jgi:hypothetical protein
LLLLATQKVSLRVFLLAALKGFPARLMKMQLTGDAFAKPIQKLFDARLFVQISKSFAARQSSILLHFAFT